MPAKKEKKNSDVGSKNSGRKNNKRKAISPLQGTGKHSVSRTGSQKPLDDTDPSQICKQTGLHNNVNNVDANYTELKTPNNPQNPYNPHLFLPNVTNMAFSPYAGQPGYNMACTPVQQQMQMQMQQQSTPPYVQNTVGTPPPMIQPTQQHMQDPDPPKWAQQIMDAMKKLETKFSKIDNIEETVKKIDQTVNTLNQKVKGIDERVSVLEQSCEFLNEEFESNKRETEQAKKSVKDLSHSIRTIEQQTKTLSDQRTEIDEKLTDLESRSMRENLMFYGITETGPEENCEDQVRNLCIQKLHIPEAKDYKFDRVHRIGKAARGKTRPIVAKFNFYKEREYVRTKSFEHSDELKAQNIRIGVQWPKAVRERRKMLYPIMEQAREQGKSVKMVKDKLYINGQLYRQTNDQAMDH